MHAPTENESLEAFLLRNVSPVKKTLCKQLCVSLPAFDRIIGARDGKPQVRTLTKLADSLRGLLESDALEAAFRLLAERAKDRGVAWSQPSAAPPVGPSNLCIGPFASRTSADEIRVIGDPAVFNAADRLVTMVEGASLTTYAWTGYGALESEITGNSTTGYAYNGQEQLAVVTDPSGDKTTYSFDGDGLRRSVATTNQSQDPPTLDVTTMVWDGSDYLLLNEPTQNRVVLTLDSEIVSCGNKDLLTDPLGSLVKEISSGASLGSLIELYPYGTRASALTKISIPFVYIAAYGYYNDSAERDYVRARELYKKLGRWMQTDPFWPDERAFEYAGCSPISATNPSGESQQVPQDLSDRIWRNIDRCPRNCHTGEIVHRMPDCFTCALNLWLKWGNAHPIHRCNAKYSHCMVCCVLASLHGNGCATDMQVLQMILPPRCFDNGPRQLDRLQPCLEGLSISRSPIRNEDWYEHCHRGCQNRYSLKNCPPNSRRGYPRKDVENACLQGHVVPRSGLNR